MRMVMTRLYHYCRSPIAIEQGDAPASASSFLDTHVPPTRAATHPLRLEARTRSRLRLYNAL